MLQCDRYIELDPLRAAMVANPGDHRWSSYRKNALGESDFLLRPHPAYLALDADPLQRQQAYRSLIMQAVDADETDTIRLHLQRQHAYGPDRFRRAIETQLGRSVGPRKIARPRKSLPDTPHS